MDYLKYFKYKYRKNENNCWEFVRYVYKEEHNIELPLLPIMDSLQAECKTFLQCNIKHNVVNEAKKGILIHVWSGDREHIGYALDNKKYMHLKDKGVRVDDIPKRCLKYEVIND